MALRDRDLLLLAGGGLALIWLGRRLLKRTEGHMVIAGQYVPAPFEVRYRWGLNVPSKRSAPPNGVVVHHPVTGSPAATFRVLDQKDLGTHFEIDRDSTVWQYADPVTDIVWHATEQNSTKIGVDMTGPPFTKAQIDRTAEVVRFLAEQIGFPLATVEWAQRGFGPEWAGVLAHHQTQGGVKSGKIDPSGDVDGRGYKLGGPEVWEYLRARLVVA